MSPMTPPLTEVAQKVDGSPSIEGLSNFRLIGQGGSAWVFRARQDQLERDVAVKILRLGAADERTRALFDVERKALGRLPKHQNIVTVFDSGFTSAGDPYLTMELCSSGSLSALLKKNGPLDIELATRCGLRVASALVTAHRNGMVHRDVKPENVLISDEGEPVLSDFGIAALVEQESTNEGAWSPHHVAPELLRGIQPTPSSDLYSLGSTVFTLLVGHPPHAFSREERPSISTILKRVDDESWVPNIPEQLHLPRELKSLLLSLLAKDPRKRMTPADEVLQAFRRVERAMETDLASLRLPTNRGLATGAVSPQDDASVSVIVDLRDASDAGDELDELEVHERTSSTHHAVQPGDGAYVPFSLVGGPQELSARRRDLTALPKVAIFGAVIAVAVVALVTITAKKSPEPGPPATVVAPGAVPQGNPLDLSAPDDVVVRRVENEPNTSLELTWTANPDSEVTYEVEVLRNSELLTTVEAASPPVSIADLDLALWTPCFRVIAKTPLGRAETSETVCGPTEVLGEEQESEVSPDGSNS